MTSGQRVAPDGAVLIEVLTCYQPGGRLRRHPACSSCGLFFAGGASASATMASSSVSIFASQRHEWRSSSL
ncbi:hypothetical protein KCP74_09060 [Salmonella enterica subsp. enterica]|nr:hypothetical protein KCP74_09060 [Salmonella enterica subsp. enterica]